MLYPCRYVANRQRLFNPRTDRWSCCAAVLTGGSKTMTSAEEAAAALRASKSINYGQQALTEESRLLLAAMLRDEMRMAVAEGISAALTDENAERFWVKGFEVAQRESRKKLRNAAGELVIGGLRGLLKWGSMAIVLLAFAWYVGGFAMVKAVWAAIKG